MNDRDVVNLSGAAGGSGGLRPQEEWRRHAAAGTPKLIRWVITHSGGVIQSTRQAVYVLWVFIVVGMAISLYIMFRSSGGGIPQIENPDYLLVPTKSLSQK